MTGDTCDALAAAIENVRSDGLFDAELTGLCPESEQLYLLAISALEQAMRFARLACYSQRKALAEMSRP